MENEELKQKRHYQQRSIDVLLLCNDVDRGFNYQGKPYSQLIDSIGDLLERNNYKVLRAVALRSELSGEKAYGNPVPLERFMNPLLPYLSGKFKNLLYRLSKLIPSLAKIDILRPRELIYYSFLKKYRPKLAIVIEPDWMICRVSKKLKIKVYDFQHGMAADDHYHYGERYMRPLPKELLPDGYFCWDEPSAQVTRKWAPEKGIEVKVVGNPWFNRFLQSDPDDKLVQDSMTEWPALGMSRLNILVTRQFLDYSKPFDELIDKLICQTGDQYNWLIRLHPVQLRGENASALIADLNNKYGHLKNVDFQQSSQVPLPVILKWADLHITSDSTVTIEASWMGIRTALVNPDIFPGGDKQTYYEYERAQGFADVLPLEAGKLENWIKENAARGKVKSLLDKHHDQIVKEVARIVKNEQVHSTRF